MSQDIVPGGASPFNGEDATGGQLVVQSLIGEGIDTVFGISGSHVLAIYDALRDLPQIRHVTMNHENNAALAAEAYARLAHRPGVVIVTAGPGATNAASGIAQAFTTAAPVIIISGSVPLNARKEIFHGVDDPTFLHRIFSAITKRSARVTRAEDILSTMADAFALAQSGRPGPVHVEIDDSVLRAVVSKASPYRRAERRRRILDAAQADAIAERLQRAQRPVIVAGKGVTVADAGEDLARLANLASAPVVSLADAQNPLSYSHPWCVGWLTIGMGLNPYCARLLREADLVLGIGLRPNADNVAVLLRQVAGNFICIGFDDQLDGRNDGGQDDKEVAQEAAVISCVAEPGRALREIANRLDARSRPADTALLTEIAAHKRSVLENFHRQLEPYRARSPLHFGLVLEELARHLTPDTVVIGDVGNHSTWTGAYLPRLGADTLRNVGPWAAMGYAIPGAIGASLACANRRVIAITGDGSFLMASADFATAASNRLPIVFLVLHDGRHGMVEMLQRRDYGRTYATEISPPDFVRYAESFGALGLRVERASDLRSTLEQALEAGSPVLVDLVCDGSVPFISWSG